MGINQRLLLYEICSKLPFGIMGHVKTDSEEFDGIITSVKNEYLLVNKNGVEYTYHINEVKPYFRKLMKISLDELEKFKKLSSHIQDKNGLSDVYNFLNSHYIETRDFINDDLALEAPNNLYYIKND